MTPPALGRRGRSALRHPALPEPPPAHPTGRAPNFGLDGLILRAVSGDMAPEGWSRLREPPNCQRDGDV